jgi:ribonuclease VapC
MIAVDTSALIAIAQREPEATACRAVLSDDPDIIISAATLAETLIVSGWRNISAAMILLLRDAGLTIIPVTGATAHRIDTIYKTWGKGIHPAALNFGDCFAYDVANEHNCPLLFIGDDFSKTDIQSALV